MSQITNEIYTGKMKHNSMGKAAVMSLPAALMRLGANRVEASLLAILAEKGGATTQELLAANSLRQPEVSTGMRRLQEKGWAISDPILMQRKGRPMHAYQLAKPVAEILASFISEGQAQAAEIQSAIQAAQDASRRLK